ncbi:coiled-coil domain-containing protein 33-like [Pantherophis guttatus]|uniref:Coiled-coil domain-containing protein 33-like n=1 Tax=Pantherophis guttatus TaxID=94885 RepID=A0ABM3YRJ2_PANGU|nr:coiled-coil domain-containing protein 33-like [Pantherophis guttatus]
MKKTAETLPTSTQESLKKEIGTLKERVANREAENQKIMIEIEGIKKENKNLEERIDCLTSMVKVLEKEEKELRELLREREDTRAALEAQNQTLAETNKVLLSEIQAVSHDLIRFQDYRASRDQNMSRMKQVLEQIVGYFGQLEGAIETAELRYADQKKQSAELRSTMDQLQKICDVQENEILCLEEQLEPFSFEERGGGSLLLGGSLPAVRDGAGQAESRPPSVKGDPLFGLIQRGLGAGGSSHRPDVFKNDPLPDGDLVLQKTTLKFASFSDILSSYHARKMRNLIVFLSQSPGEQCRNLVTKGKKGSSVSTCGNC